MNGSYFPYLKILIRISSKIEANAYAQRSRDSLPNEILFTLILEC